jgi:hypothetical protein
LERTLLHELECGSVDAVAFLRLHTVG